MIMNFLRRLFGGSSIENSEAPPVVIKSQPVQDRPYVSPKRQHASSSSSSRSTSSRSSSGYSSSNYDTNIDSSCGSDSGGDGGGGCGGGGD